MLPSVTLILSFDAIKLTRELQGRIGVTLYKATNLNKVKKIRLRNIAYYYHLEVK